MNIFSTKICPREEVLIASVFERVFLIINCKENESHFSTKDAKEAAPCKRFFGRNADLFEQELNL